MSDRPPSSETPPSGYARIMTVFGAILNDGPAGLERTMQLTGLPRSATWRCLTTLEAEGWLCRRLSDGAFRLTASACAGFERAHQTHPLAEALVPFLRQLSKSGRLSIDLVAFAAPGRLIQIETNRSDPIPASQEDFFEDPLSIAALIAQPAEARLMHVKAALAHATQPEANEVLSGRFTRAVAQAAPGGDIWDPERQTLCVPLVGGALRLEGTGSTRRTEKRLRGFAASLRQAYPEIAPEPRELVSRFWPRLGDAKRGQTPR